VKKGKRSIRRDFTLPYGYTLVIAEKPKAAAKIAEALGLNRKGYIEGIPYWWGYFNNRLVVVAPTAGHLFSLNSDKGGYPIFNYRWVPRWYVEKNSKHLRKFYEALKKLSQRARYYVNACDYDIEGSVIGYMIIKEFGDLSRAKRVKFSSLTKDELRKAFMNLMPLDVGMVEAGLCRHELDWIWGINISRALMDIIRQLKGERLILSAGRVQSPTLIEAYKRFIERELFVPIISFTITVKIRYGGREYNLEPLYEPLNSRMEAIRLVEETRSLGKAKVIDARTQIRTLEPPPPFNLPDLQLEASRIYGLSPSETLKIAEDLYLEGIISYPRTNSQQLPPTLNNRLIIEALSKDPQYRVYAMKLLKRKVLKPVKGSKTDLAHPAIYPTGELPKRKLSEKEVKVYDLIVRRYLASFGDKSRIICRRYVFSVGKLRYSLSGCKVLDYGWLEIYPFNRMKDEDIPILKAGDYVPISSVKITHVYTKPPQLYTKASLLKWMEEVGIGTEATRADIIDILFKRGYLRSTPKGIEITEIGMIVANILNSLFTELTSVELTRRFEEYLNKVILGEISRAEVVTRAKEVIASKLNSVKESIVKYGLEYIKRISNVGDEENKCSLCWRRSSHELIIGTAKVKLCDLHTFEEFSKHINRLTSLGGLCRDILNLMNKYGFKP